MGVVFKKWVWLAKFLQTEPPLKNPGYAPAGVWYFGALRQLLVEPKAQILIKLLNICFLDNTDLVQLLIHSTKKTFGANMSKKWGGGGSCPPAPPPPPPTHTHTTVVPM